MVLMSNAIRSNNIISKFSPDTFTLLLGTRVKIVSKKKYRAILCIAYRVHSNSV